LIANFLDADLLENYTHVDGIYSADPEIVENAFIIESLSYEEANEMVNFGTNVLHAKTIIPLIQKQIPIKILNTFKPNSQIGTLIHNSKHQSGARNLSVLKNKSLIHFIGRGLLGKIGVDSRIFSTLSAVGVNVNLISQGSSERGIGIVIDTAQVEQALQALHHEFRDDLELKDVEKIFAEDHLAIVSIIGEDLQNLNKPFQSLIRNQITPILFNNTITGKNISLLIHENVLSKSLKILHGEMFNKHKTIHLSLFGNGQVGGALIHQIFQNREKILQKRNIDLKIFSISNSKGSWIDKQGLPENYQEKSIFVSSKELQAEQVIAFAKKENLENLILIDNTASLEVAKKYELFVQNGFDIVSSNKIHNTLSLSKYKNLRSKLTEFHKTYLYETNVGAGLPLIDNIRLLHLSGDNILKITGVFSGSLSYIFNTFSENDIPFSEVIKKAMTLGFTEPDPREDLSGNDVARKLLVLARELDFEMELNEIQIVNLIPESLREIEKSQFLNSINEMDAPYLDIKNRQVENHVLRYVGNLVWNPVLNKGKLEVKLLSVSKNSVLGRVSGSDSIFEIYTESYGDNPIIIQGAGAGAQVTARGVFGDILKISEIVK
jgi:aspartokinase/homoserine dehydrogenase 1